ALLRRDPHGGDPVDGARPRAAHAAAAERREARGAVQPEGDEGQARGAPLAEDEEAPARHVLREGVRARSEGEGERAGPAGRTYGAGGRTEPGFRWLPDPASGCSGATRVHGRAD